MSRSYLEVVYDEKRTPKSGYPDKLANYLCKRSGLEKGDKFLEIGPGRGDFLLAFKRLGLNCYGVDIEVNPNLSKEVEVKSGDVERDKLPYADSEFDVVYHKSLIEHMDSPDNLMREAYRVLKPGGKVIVLTPDWVSQMKVFYEDITHKRPYDQTAVRDALAMGGFRNIVVERFHQLPIVWSLPPVKFVTAFLRIFLSAPGGRRITKFTRIKFFRWAVELMVLGVGEK